MPLLKYQNIERRFGSIDFYADLPVLSPFDDGACKINDFHRRFVDAYMQFLEVFDNRSGITWIHLRCKGRLEGDNLNCTFALEASDGTYKPCGSFVWDVEDGNIVREKTKSRK